MKYITKLILVSILTFLCLQSCNSHIEKYTKQENKIISGEGLEAFKIKQTSIDEVITTLGKDYEEINHNEYSIEIIYKKLGLSFYYLLKDEEKKLFTIKFSAPFNGITDKGFKIGDTLQSVIDIYGTPNWYSCDACDVWRATYEDIGLEFVVNRDKTLPHFPLNEEVHLQKKITRICVQ
ncbi:hypothetical protein H2O64_13830 [Kordia sp. YSTF-M3]|uniref:Lipoprotein n=1 Tax=Kordia aestuariivivens TaxID=2759037 RepID=A0ABR7QBL7_9FLAO|nr:hypothetical protein [Kordia aestuariivivens]MBC8755751.1 hypothetical protein [Kordia aestuariivivens]